MNILICLEKLGIGGVETYVLNQIYALKKQGYNIFVLASRDLRYNAFISLGINFIEYNFSLDDYFNNKEFANLKKIIIENNINQVHIHQYTALRDVWPVCIFLNIPYVVYIHSIIPGVDEWFCAALNVYNRFLVEYFQNAEKIICITESVKEDNMQRYNLPNDKYIIIPNGINFEKLPPSTKISKIERFSIFSRLSKEKMINVHSAINFFKKWNESFKSSELFIYGDGPLKKKLSKKEYSNIYLKGSTDKPFAKMNEFDVIMGCDRVILEAISLKKIAIVCGYNGLVGLVTKENIKSFAKENFSGNNLPTIDDNDLYQQLNKMTIDEIQNIVEENYQYVKENYDCINSFFVLPGDTSVNYKSEFVSEINKYCLKKATLKSEIVKFIRRVKRKLLKRKRK